MGILSQWCSKTPHLLCFSANASALPLRGGLSVPSCEEHGSDLTVTITMFRCDTAQLRLDQKRGAILLSILGACQGVTHCHIRVSLLEAFRFRRQNWPLHVEDLGLHKQTEVSGPSPAPPPPSPITFTIQSHTSESTSDSKGSPLLHWVCAPNHSTYEQTVIVTVSCYVWDILLYSNKQLERFRYFRS